MPCTRRHRLLGYSQSESVELERRRYMKPPPIRMNLPSCDQIVAPEVTASSLQPVAKHSVEATSSGECPLHVAMQELAQAAVRQHVLYLEGECLPRPELMQTIERWCSFSAIISSRVCVVSRTATIAPAELDAVLETLFPSSRDAVMPPIRQSLFVSCTRCAQATSCPLGKNPITVE